MRALWLSVLTLSACAAPEADARSAELRSTLVRADEVLLRARPALVAGKYARMRLTPFELYRGNLAIARRDWELGRTSQTAFPETLAAVRGIGDPHPENFGILVATDATAALEPNDFDAADRVPALFDVRRLVIGMALFARLSGHDDAEAEAIARETAAAWAAGLTAEPKRIDAGGGEPVLEDLFRRSARDLAARAELTNLTEVTADGRRFRRGPPDPTEPTQTLQELPASIRVEVGALVARFGFVMKDAVREQGSGVASWPRIRVQVLVEGPTDSDADDVVLEVKELTESPLAGWYAPVLPAASAAARVGDAARTAWSRADADAHYFTAEWLGFPVQLRTESEAHKTVRLDRLTGARGTVQAITALGRTLGGLLARVHAASAVVPPGDAAAFAAEQGELARREAQQAIDDHGRFGALLDAHGPTLGFTPAPSDVPPVDFASLLGAPP